MTDNGGHHLLGERMMDTEHWGRPEVHLQPYIS